MIVATITHTKTKPKKHQHKNYATPPKDTLFFNEVGLLSSIEIIFVSRGIVRLCPWPFPGVPDAILGIR